MKMNHTQVLNRQSIYLGNACKASDKAGNSVTVSIFLLIVHVFKLRMSFFLYNHHEDWRNRSLLVRFT